MNNIAIQPMQWEETPDISAVEGFSEKDEQCFREIRDVLKKYDALDRFGLSLVHSHFDVAADEIMMEYTDHENRTHIIKPVKQSEIDESEVTITHWKLTEGETVAARRCVCARRQGGHLGRHEIG